MPELSITIPGTIRIKKNSKRIFSMGKYKKVLPSEAYLLWEENARAFIRQSSSIMPPLTRPVEVKALCYIKGHKPDLSGALESVGDAMQGIIWADDKQIFSWDGSRVIHDKDNPRTEITVRW
ncbi:MAG: Endodeoxyribonuclease RusA [Pelotomaculum sp. PtaB.Bin104]|nr:MAG: Endodeoxyribonuclease RusA [Pelotomaculum sp. PtaB.Bin104]